MKYWIISASEKVYDHYGAFDKIGYLDWGVKANMSVGDIVYLYFRSPIMRIRCKTEVIKSNLQYDEITDDEEFWLNGNNRTYKNKYVRLKLIGKTENSKLAYSLLKIHGIGNNTLQGNYEIKQQELIDYIEAAFNENQSEGDRIRLDDRNSYLKNNNELNGDHLSFSTEPDHDINAPLKVSIIHIEDGTKKYVCRKCGYVFLEASRCPECGQKVKE